MGSRWKKVYLAMFTVYIDDSGSDPKQQIANATALIVPAAQIVRLEQHWDKFKGKYGFSCFHTSEFVAKNGKKEPKFSEWDEETRLRVFRRVREISKKFGVSAISITVNKKDYDEVVPAAIRAHAGKYHYTWAIRSLLSHLVQWRSNRNIPLPLEYVFDRLEEKPRKREIEDVLDQAEEQAIEEEGLGNLQTGAFAGARTSEQPPRFSAEFR